MTVYWLCPSKKTSPNYICAMIQTPCTVEPWQQGTPIIAEVYSDYSSLT